MVGMTKAGLEIRKNYGRLVSLQDGFKAVRKARLGTEAKVMKEVIVA